MAQRASYDVEKLQWTIDSWSDEDVSLGGYPVPRAFTADLNHPDWPAAARLEVEVESDGPVARGIRAQFYDTPQIGYKDIHDALTATVPMPSLLRALVSEVVARKVSARLGDDAPFPELMRQVRRDAQQAWSVAYPRRRRSVTDELLAQVAEVYREQTGTGAPTAAVAERFSVTHSTAARWVREARAREFLGRARGPRPGEMKKQEKP